MITCWLQYILDNDVLLISTWYIGIISLHGQNSRILTTTFTQDYYESLKMPDQTSSNHFNIHTDSFHIRDDDAQITHLAQKLMKDA